MNYYEDGWWKHICSKSRGIWYSTITDKQPFNYTSLIVWVVWGAPVSDQNISPFSNYCSNDIWYDGLKFLSMFICNCSWNMKYMPLSTYERFNMTIE